MGRSLFRNSLLIPFVFLCLSLPVSAQSDAASITRADAVRTVKIPSISGWQEVVSAENKFRILFPGKPEVDDDVISLKGWKFVAGDTRWFAYCSDLGEPRASDDQYLREAYKSSVVAIIKNGARLLRQVDVKLNGRLGSEFVIASPGKVSYMRSFMFRNRLYTLAIDRMEEVGSDAANPTDVQQFFDSFTYWDSE